MTMWSPALHPPEPPPARELSLDAWIELPEDIEGELVDGRLTEEEVPDPIHGLAVSWLIALLRAWLSGRGGFIFDSDVKVVVGPRGGRKPDLTVYLPGRRPPPRRGALRDPPDLVVEVISASPRDERRDRVEKMKDYARAGIRHYWLLDPALGSFEVFELEASGRYAIALAGTDGRLEGIPGCDGLVVDLDALWGELARLAPEPEA
jgi:Uma2 family endonuclease